MFVLQAIPGGLTTQILVPYATLNWNGMLYLCREQGPIHPAFILAAFAVNKGWDHATIGYNPKNTAPHWKAALDGLIALAKHQSATIFVSEKELTTKTELGVVGVSLEVGNATKGAPTAVVDNIFVSSDDYGARTIPRKYLMAALQIEKKHNASVAALVVSSQGAIVSCGIKSEGEHGCGHAEVKAIFAINGDLPKGGAIISTLKPCAMCMGLIHGLDPNNSVKKFWGRPDASDAANWGKLQIGKGVAEYFQLDKDCENYSTLKLPGSGDSVVSFADRFNLLFTNKDYGKIERREPSDATLALEFIKGFKATDGMVWIDKKKELVKANKIGELKKGITTIPELTQSLASNKNKPGAGLSAQHLAKVNDEYKKHRSSRLDEARRNFESQLPASMIGFICRAPSAVALRGLVDGKFAQQVKKYADVTGDEQPKTRTQLQKGYLMTYLNSYVAAS